jgi:hypothetical protein
MIAVGRCRSGPLHAATFERPKQNSPSKNRNKKKREFHVVFPVRKAAESMIKPVKVIDLQTIGLSNHNLRSRAEVTATDIKGTEEDWKTAQEEKKTRKQLLFFSQSGLRCLAIYYHYGWNWSKEKLREKELERRAKRKMMDRRYVW